MRSPELVVVALVTAVALAAFALTHWSVWLLAAGLIAVYLVARAHGISLQRADDERRHALQMSELHLATIEALALAIDAKDHTAQNHVRRVQYFATRLASELGVTEQEQAGIRTAALLHDVGKLAVPEHILTKPGQLSAEEWRKVRSHPQIGAEIIAAIPFPFPVAPLVLSHHERWDGTGYPDGLAGALIPLSARLMAVADVYDALISARPYKKAFSHEEAMRLIDEGRGGHFDPEIVDALHATETAFQTIAETWRDA